MLIATEAALWGSVKAHGFLPDTVIVSDDAGQFNVGQHGLCWVHAERLVHKLDTFTDEQPRRPGQRPRADLAVLRRSQGLSRALPASRRKADLRARFDRIFLRNTGFVTLDRLLARLHANKAELLMVLDHPEIPLHTNGSENDIRCQVTKRKVSGGTTQRCRTRLPRRIPRPRQDLRQARHRVLGLPRLKTGCPRQPGHPIPAGIGRHPTPTALTAASFAPITKSMF